MLVILERRVVRTATSNKVKAAVVVDAPAVPGEVEWDEKNYDLLGREGRKMHSDALGMNP